MGLELTLGARLADPNVFLGWMLFTAQAYLS